MDSNNSSIHTVVRWYPEPDQRGTVSFLWSCFATIFICTWSAVHPNLPPDGKTPLQLFGYRIWLLIAAIIGPEWVTYMALRNLRSVQLLKRDLPGWTLSQTFFVAMGGFCIQTDPNEPDDRIRVSPIDLIQLWNEKKVEMPDPNRLDIDDRSKADWVTKSIALIQVAWFITQTIARAVEGLPVTTLEIFTASIVLCSAITYILWWEKPFEVRKPIVLHPNPNAQFSTSWPEDMKRIPLSWFIDNHHGGSAAFITATCLVFGGLHLTAWDFWFPSVVERWLWRASSIASMCLPLLFIIYGMTIEGSIQEHSFIHRTFAIVLPIVYVTVRAYMFVEMLIGLRALPLGVYATVKWSQYIPSFS